MATRLLNIALRCALLAAIVASTALFVDYQGPAGGGFCGQVDTGCGHVRSSPYSHIGPVGLPSVGLGGFLGIFATSLWASRRRQLRILAALASAAGLGALVLIGLQLFVVETVCAWCMAVDASAIVAAAAALGLAKVGEQPEPRAVRGLWAGAGVVCVAVPLMWETPPKPAEVPRAVAQLYTPDRVDVVSFTDFECPHCRRLHPAIGEVVDDERIHLTRIMVPLRIHPGAKPAARAYLCTPEDARHAMADRLYEAEHGELNTEGLVQIAGELGLDTGRLAECMAAEGTQQRIEEHSRIFEEAGLKGVPATYVEQERVVGARNDAVRAAVDRALAGHSAEGGANVAYMFALLLIVVLAVAGVSLYARPAGDTSLKSGSELD